MGLLISKFLLGIRVAEDSGIIRMTWDRIYGAMVGLPVENRKHRNKAKFSLNLEWYHRWHDVLAGGGPRSFAASSFILRLPSAFASVGPYGFYYSHHGDGNSRYPCRHDNWRGQRIFVTHFTLT